MSSKTYGQPPEFNLDPEKTYKAVIEMDNGNKITIDLLSREAPKTVNNFVFLARDGYYDGITFHRVIPGFMAQSGDPTGTGSGGPGYNFDDEFHDDAKHDSAGILSMANRGVVNGIGTNGSGYEMLRGWNGTKWVESVWEWLMTMEMQHCMKMERF